MKLDFKITGQSETIQLIRKFEKLTGKGVEDGIREMALSTARQLAIKVQPYGISDKGKGKKFVENIEKQVTQVFIGVNLGQYSETSNLRSAHRSNRNRGRIRGDKITKQPGQRWKNVIDRGQLERVTTDQQAKAGRAKAAWLTAGNSLGVGRASKIGKWIDRHIGKGYGGHNMLGRGIRAVVQLYNNTTYLTGPQKNKDVAAALKLGRANAIKRMQTIVAKQAAKAQP